MAINGFPPTSLGAASSSQFYLLGGVYGVSVVGTFTGAVDLQVIGPDGSTLISTLVSPIGANAALLVQLPPGTYQFVVTGTASGVWASCSPIRLSP